MNEVKDVCTRMLEAPEPPLRDGAEVLAIARRSTRRQALRTASLAAASVLTVVGAAVGVIGPGLAQPPAPDSVAASGDSALGRDAPAARAAAIHGRQMTNTLLRAVPSGHTAWIEDRFSDDEVVHPRTVNGHPDGRILVLAGAAVTVSTDGGHGRLFAYLAHDGRPPPVGDLCAVAPARGAGACEVVVIGRVPVRVVTTRDPVGGESIEATRFLRGGQLTVAAWQGVPRDGTPRSGRSRLDRPFLTVAQVAALAADPRMLQFP